MPRKEFIHLMQENVTALDRIGQRLKLVPLRMTEFPPQQISALARLHLGGAARLKDIATREVTTTSNLCAMFRKLERAGLVSRTVDEGDRRNTYYAITPQGEEIARRAIAAFQSAIEKMFANITPDDEEKLTDALRTINQVLKNMEK